MQNRNHFRHLVGLAILGAMLDHHRSAKDARAADREASPASTTGEAAQQAATQSGSAPSPMDLPGMLGKLFDLPPIPGAADSGAGIGCDGCGTGAVNTATMDVVIPEHIADAAGMTAPGFDITSPTGRIVGTLAAAQVLVQALGEAAPTAPEKARFTHASASIGLAIALLRQ